MKIDIDTSKISEREFSDLIKSLLVDRYIEATKVNVGIWSYAKTLDSIQIIPTYEFKGR